MSDSKKIKDSAYTVFNAVDARVSKPVLGSDGAAAWQNFRADTKQPQSHHGSVAPTAPLKAADRAAGFASWKEERQNEAAVRRQAGEAAVNAGYTQFEKDGKDNDTMTKKERQRIEKRLMAEDQEYFLPSKTWQGPKWDYVFTTKAHHGTGYFFDGMDSLKKLRGEITVEEQQAVMNASSTSEDAAGVGVSHQKRPVAATQEDTKVEKTTHSSSSDEPKKKKKKKKKSTPAAPVMVHDPHNPREQVAAALQKRLLQQQSQGGWEEAVDATTGKTYYYHRASGERSWERPPSLQDDNDWQTATDAATGKTYYYNTATGATAWERPPAAFSG